ncbi:MAG: universal stress protein [Armatimonadota bacterium]
MFKKILIPTDFSEPSVKIIERIPQFKAMGTEEVIIFFALRTLDAFMGETYIEFSYIEDVENYAKKEMAKMKEYLENHGLKAKILIEFGNPSILILDAARNEDVNLIIMSSHGHGAGRDFHLGSVAHSVLHHAQRPVLIEKVKWEKDKNGKDVARYISKQAYSKVLLPTDFSERAEYALSALKSFVKMGAKEVALLHVQDVGKLVPHLEYKIFEFDSIDNERLNKVKTELDPLGLKVKTIVDHGVPADEIIKKAEEVKANLIIMGAYGRNPFAEFFLGSVSERVVQKSSKDVLVI